MSKKDAITLASRTLALLFGVWALTEASYLPGSLNSFLHYATPETAVTTSVQYWRHMYILALGFHVTRIVGYTLLSSWLYQGGSEVEKLILPSVTEGTDA